MAGEWIPAKARTLLGMFPGQWEEVQTDIYQGRCPGEHLHHGKNAATDCRVHTGYGAAGQTPGIYCLHQSCKGILEDLNKAFREALFARDPNYQPREQVDAGVVKRPPQSRESWIPYFNIGKLRGLVGAMPTVNAEWFMERSPVDPRKVGPGDFLEHAFRPGERVIVFTEFRGPGDFLWEVGKGGYRLAEQRGVKAVRSALPTDGGKDGAWYLCNPVDGAWHPNPRRNGIYSRRSMESVTSWRHLVLECDEEKTLRKWAGALKEARPHQEKGDMEKVEEIFKKQDPRWVGLTKEWPAENWPAIAEQYEAQAAEVPGLWMKFLGMAPLAIKAIYSSGGASMHALVEVNMADKATFDAYLRGSAKRSLPLIGADPGAMTPVRLTRLPGCTRGGRLQQLIYLNPNPSAEGVPIRDLPKKRSL